MKTLILLSIVAILKLSNAFMNVKDFEISKLLRCYSNLLDSGQMPVRNVKDQFLPLPNSVETFISLVERYESMNPNVQVRELVENLLKSFRIDDLHSEVSYEEIKLRDTAAFLHNRIKRIIFSIPDTSIQKGFYDEDFTEDEECALHFMLSHTINSSRVDNTDEFIEDTNLVKQPREIGVVSLHSKRKHAFALGRVLLGIQAAYLTADTEEISTIIKREKTNNDVSLQSTKINLVYAVTLGDLVTRLVVKDDAKMLPGGEWTDISCPREYKLEENKGGFVSYSELRGAIDGLIIGRKIQENRQDYANFRLSQILRMYYGYSGLLDTDKTQWCDRENFQNIPDLDTDMLNFNKLYRAISDGGTVGPKTLDKIRDILSDIRSNIFKDVETEECRISKTSLDRRYESPRNIFVILDYSATAKLDFQAEVIGNLSNDFDIRPRGNLMGVYTNFKPSQQNTLDVVTKNSGIAGCPSCFTKYYKRSGSKQDEAELLKDLNGTLANFDIEQEQLEEKYQSESKAGSPGKIVLYFNFGSSNPDYRLRDALWGLRRYFGGATILAVGDNRESLTHFVENDQTDIFTASVKTAQDLKLRFNKVPAEFTYRACNQSNPSREADNKQEVFISPNKIQYWAMYPQYFLKSYGIKLKFRAEEGAQIKVCFSRSYSSIVDGKNENCKDSASGEVEFYERDPCKKKNVFNCYPFYFSIEGRKPGTLNCQSLRCNTPSDIKFEFEHEGISCNIASYVSLSSLALLLASIMYYIQRQ